MPRSLVPVESVVLIEGVSGGQVIVCAEGAIRGMVAASGDVEMHPAAYVLGAISAARACLVHLDAPGPWRARLAEALADAMADVTPTSLPVQ